VGRLAPVLSDLLLPDAVLKTHGCSGFYKLCRPPIVLTKLSRSACIDKGPVGGPQAHDDAHRCATGRTAGRERCRGAALCRLASDRVSLHDQQADGIGREGTAGKEKAEMPAFPAAIGQDVLEEPAETFHDVAGGGASARPAHFPGGDGDGTVCEAHDTAVGERDPEDIGGEVCAGGGSVVVGLSGDIPGDVPDWWGAMLQESGVAHVFFADGAVDGCEGVHGDKEVGARGLPGRAVLREATARHDGVAVGVVRELPAPGLQDTEKTREVRPDETLVFGEPFEGERRGVAHGVGRDALRRADQGTQGRRDGEGDKDVRPGQWFFQVVLEPLRGCMLRPLGTGAVATGMIDTVLPRTVLALLGGCP
jgi:hypothetical protein